MCVYPIDTSGETRQISTSGQRDRVAAADLIWAAGLAKSRGEAKRLLGQSAVEVDQQRHSEPWIQLRDGTVIRVADAASLAWRIWTNASDEDERYVPVGGGFKPPLPVKEAT